MALTTEQVQECRDRLEQAIRFADRCATETPSLEATFRGERIGLQMALTWLNEAEPHELVVKDITEEFYAKNYNSQPVVVDPA